jgi:hypothetical protein
MSALQIDWITTNNPPSDNRVIETKIDDEHGVRNEQTLRYLKRQEELHGMWFLPDMSMYIYYTPTHWRDVTPPMEDE